MVVVVLRSDLSFSYASRRQGSEAAWFALVVWRVDLLPGAVNEPSGISARPHCCHPQTSNRAMACFVFLSAPWLCCFGLIVGECCFNKRRHLHFLSLLRETENTDCQTPSAFIANLCCSVPLMLTDALELFNHAAKHEGSLSQGRKLVPRA